MMSEKFKPYTSKSLVGTPYWDKLPESSREDLQLISHVLPFRTNAYVLRELIDWSCPEDDPIFRLNFPHRDMLAPADYATLRQLVSDRNSAAALAVHVAAIRSRMNPHPAGQMSHNVPELDGALLHGLQHKYRETVLFFPAAGQTCHAYCTFCFRWPQFVGIEELKFSARQSDELVAYVRAHPQVSDVLFTGGDPMVMNTASLAAYLLPLLEIEHVHNIRIGTKSVAYWPQRFVTDRDADDLMRLFERVVRSGKNLALMGHYSHPVELASPVAQQAVRRITATGATLRMQSPVLRHINDSPEVWRTLWATGTRLGAIPYYMFVERDTGPHAYFAIPLARAHEIFQSAYQQVSGLARTVRGPSMSTHAGKVTVDGIATIAGETVFALQFIQARDPTHVRQPFYAAFDPDATWMDQLRPAFGQARFFHEAGPSVASPQAPQQRLKRLDFYRDANTLSLEVK